MLCVATGCWSRVVGLNWNLNELSVLQTTSLCSHQTEPTFSSHIFGRVDEASASHGGVVRARKSGVGGARGEREAVNKQLRNFDDGQIRDVD